MAGGVTLMLAFGLVLIGGLYVTSGIQDRSLKEVLKGKTSHHSHGEPREGETAKEAQAKEPEPSSAGIGGPRSGAPGPGAAFGPGPGVGTPITPTSPTPGGTRGAQRKFGDALAAFSGLSRKVIEKWLLAEQPPGSPSAPGSNNWLNVQFTDQGPNGEYWRIAKLDPISAARATVEWMRKNQPSILGARGKSEFEQEQAIINSGWASSKYGGHL
jgi:hypothetical protein